MSNHTTTRNMPAKAFLKWLAPDRVIVKLWKQGSAKPSLNKAFFAMQPPKDLKILDEDGHEIEDMLLCDIRQHQFLHYEDTRYHVKGVDGKHHHKRCLFLHRQQQQRHQHQSSQTTSRGLGLRELTFQKQTLEQSCQTLTPPRKPRVPTVLFPKEGRAADTARTVTKNESKSTSPNKKAATAAAASTLRRSGRQRKSVGRLITE